MDRFQALQGPGVAAAQTLEDLQVHRQRVEGPTEVVQQAIQIVGKRAHQVMRADFTAWMPYLASLLYSVLRLMPSRAAARRLS